MGLYLTKVKGFTNPSVILAIGIDSDNRAYVMEEFYQTRVMIDDLIDVAKKMQEKYGEGVFYADPSEPQFISAFNNAGLSCTAAKNEIMPGINKVSTMLEVKDDKRAALYVDPSCLNTIMEFENYSYPEVKEGRPELDKPLKVHDHCLVAGTKIETSKGSKNIEDIKVGEFVLTRKGYKKVLKSGLTIRKTKVCKVEFSNGKNLIGTPDHKVWTEKGFVPIDALRYAYKVESLNNNAWIKLSSKELFLKNGNKQDTIELDKEKQESNICIEKSGKSIMEKSQKDTKSITKTKTNKITKSQTLNVLRLKNTAKNIQKNIQKNILKESDHLLKNGMLQKKDSNGTSNMELNLGIKENLLQKSAKTVTKNLKTFQEEQDFVQTIAKAVGEDGVFVLLVKHLAKKADVYDLTIEGCHEFYANEILVHNSMDALRYAIRSLGKNEFVVLEELGDLFNQD